jgi:Protein of unknown function (DUF1569)
MNVDTSHVQDRREVRYESYQDLLAEIEQLLGGDVRTLGNWSLGQVLKHLAETMHASIDGAPYRAGLMRRITGPWLLRDQFLNRGMTPGFQLPQSAREALIPGPTTGEAGLAALRRALYRLRAETDRAAHPVIGRLSVEEWDRCHLRHAELHMSFMLPLYDTIAPVGPPAAKRG